MGLGRGIELYQRVKTNDPAASTLVVVPVDVVAVSDATLKDLDTLAAIISAGVFEVTSTNYGRKVLADTDLAANATPTDVGDFWQVALPDQTWTNPTSTGAHANSTDLLVCYDPAGTGVTSAMIPLTCHDFVITVDTGVDILADFLTVGAVDAGGFLQAK